MVKIPDWLLSKGIDIAADSIAGNPKKGPIVAGAMSSQFASLIIRSVIASYAVWGVVAISDLAMCESRRPGQCEPQRAELRGVATTIPATLLAWLADSPVVPHGSLVQKLGARKPRQSDADAG